MNQEQLIAFLNKYKDLIDSYNYDELYERFRDDVTIFSGYLTKLLLKAGINPLDHMKQIPPYYAYNTDISGTFIIPDHITWINNYAFESCQNITKIVLHDKVEHIGAGAFFGCVYLQEIELPESCEFIGPKAFSFCDMLEEIYLPKTMKDIIVAAFQNYSGKVITYNKKIYQKLLDFNVKCELRDN